MLEAFVALALRRIRDTRGWCMAAVAALGAWLLLGAAANGEEVKPELANVRLAVGGKPALFYLPLTITERLGYFRDAGLTVEIQVFPAARGHCRRSSAAVPTWCPGPTTTPSRCRPRAADIAVVLLGPSGDLLGGLSGRAQGYHTPADLKGMRVGVTAPG